MGRGPLLILTICVAFLSAVPFPVDGAEEDEMVQTQKGLRFAVPDDWPIEKRAGILGPIPVEEYVAMKFDNVLSQFDAVTQALDETRGQMATLVADLERDTAEKFKNLYTDVDDIKFQVETLASDIDRLRTSLQGIESGIKVIDNRITQQFPSLDERIGALERRTRSIELHLDKIWMDLQE
jgi:methyl-accepting chemotaxis protein